MCSSGLTGHDAVASGRWPTPWQMISCPRVVIESVLSGLTAGPIDSCPCAKHCSGSVTPRVTYVRIDRWDTWSMDHTLAMIVLPMLRQLQATKHGAPLVDDQDVPEHLRSTQAPPKENDYDTDGNHFARWDWVLDEMIWAFEQTLDDNSDSQFYSGTHDHRFVPVDADNNEVPRGEHKYFRMEDGPNNTFKVDREGLKAWHDRRQRAFVLFGKYYQSLWD
jgi:hypothetical protein